MGEGLSGRDAELDGIRRVLWRAEPATVAVSGDAGVGKSRLAETLVEEAAARDWAVATAEATASAATIPFGALAHLLPLPRAEASDPLPYLQQALMHLSAEAAERRMLLFVDDAHRLDEASAVLLHQLARGRMCSLLLTVRAGEPRPEAVDRLIASADAAIRLQPLDRDATQAIVETELGAPLVAAGHAALWALSRGNPLYLKWLIADAQESGQLERVGDTWRLRGQLTPGRRLQELVAGRLRRLRPDERAAVELLAVGEPLELALFLDQVGPETLGRLEQRRLLRGTRDRNRRWLVLTHPTLRETIREGLPLARLREVAGRLADALEKRGARRRGDLLRLAVWRLDSGGAPDPVLFAAAARRALSLLDAELAERLARRVADDRFDAVLTLAEALSHQRRIDEADAAFEQADGAASTPPERRRVALAHSEHLFFRAGRPAEATALLEQLASSPGLPPDAEDVVRAALAMFSAVGGDLPGAAEAGARILARPDASPEVAVRTLFISTLADAVLGRVARAREGVRVALRHADAVRDVMPLAVDVLRVNDLIAQLCAGRICEVEASASDRLREVIGLDAADVVGMWRWVAIEALLLRGRVDAARESATEALAALERRDPLGIRPNVQALAAIADAMGGHAPAAAVRGDEAPPIRGDARAVTLGARARAWTATVGGPLPAAARLALEAGRVAEDLTQLLWAAFAYHDAVRFGAAPEAREHLAALADRMEGDLIATMHAHAVAAADGDAMSLEEVSAAFERLGADLLAAEAAAGAARAASGHRPRLSRRCAGRARALARHCTGADTPALRRMGGEGLSDRELEVAELAARGHASREIAERLVLSRRTVDNYLGSAYRKLGIAGREELSYVLGVRESPSEA